MFDKFRLKDVLVQYKKPYYHYHRNFFVGFKTFLELSRKVQSLKHPKHSAGVCDF